MAPVHTVDRRLVARRAADRLRGPQVAYGGARPGPCCYAAHSEIYVMNADGSGTRKLTHNALQNAEPAWSPDGRKIAFRSRRAARRKRAQQGYLRHERRRKRKTEPHTKRGVGQPPVVVTGWPKDRVRQQPRRASRSSRHERRRKRSAEPDGPGEMRRLISASPRSLPRCRAEPGPTAMTIARGWRLGGEHRLCKWGVAQDR